MARKVPKAIKKSFNNYAVEFATELKELSKFNIIALSGRYTEQKIFISIDKPTVIEVRVYDLSNFAKHVYIDFNRKLKKLLQ